MLYHSLRENPWNLWEKNIILLMSNSRYITLRNNIFEIRFIASHRILAKIVQLFHVEQLFTFKRYMSDEYSPVLKAERLESSPW